MNITDTQLAVEAINEMLRKGELKVGDKLLSERKLAESLGLGRVPVREAIKKLEFQGVLQSRPKRGTFVIGIDLTPIQDAFSNVLEERAFELQHLSETRLGMEREAVSLCCRRRTDEDLALMKHYIDQHELNYGEGSPAVEYDLMFHKQIFLASKNPLLISMSSLILPHVVTQYSDNSVCKDGNMKTVAEHKLLLEYIKLRDVVGAQNIIGLHFKDLVGEV